MIELPESDGTLPPSSGSWSVDPTLLFNRIHIIESLGAGFAGRSGLRLSENLQDLSYSTPIKVAYHSVATEVDIRAVMSAIVSEAQAGLFPMIHLEAHGEERQPGRARTSRGLVLSSGALFSWRDLAPYLVDVNRATAVRLLVFSASCFGADILTLVQPLKPAPARVLIGPMDTISTRVLETGTLAFYRSLVVQGNGAKAVTAMQEATKGAFLVFLAEDLFLRILTGYFNELTTESQVAARVELFIADMVLAGVPADQISKARKRGRDYLSDRKLVFDEAYRKYFFVDEVPENAGRFLMSYETCFESAPTNGTETV